MVFSSKLSEININLWNSVSCLPVLMCVEIGKSRAEMANDSSALNPMSHIYLSSNARKIVLLAIIVKHGVPVRKMSIAVLSIVRVSMNKITSMVIRVHVDDWTAERAINHCW